MVQLKTSTKLFLTCAAAALGLASWHAKSHFDPSPPALREGAQSWTRPAPASTTLPRELATKARTGEESRRIAELAEQVSALEARLGALAEQAPQAREDPVDPASRARELAAYERKNWQAMKESFSNAHESEPVDTAWSREQTSRIEAVFAHELATGNQLESVDCRANLCRLVVAHRDEGARGLLSDVLSSEPLRGGSYHHPSGEPDQSIAYVFREDRPQPIRAALEASRSAARATMED